MLVCPRVCGKPWPYIGVYIYIHMHIVFNVSMVHHVYSYNCIFIYIHIFMYIIYIYYLFLFKYVYIYIYTYVSYIYVFLFPLHCHKFGFTRFILNNWTNPKLSRVRSRFRARPGFSKSDSVVQPCPKTRFGWVFFSHSFRLKRLDPWTSMFFKANAHIWTIRYWIRKNRKHGYSPVYVQVLSSVEDEQRPFLRRWLGFLVPNFVVLNAGSFTEDLEWIEADIIIET